MPPVPRVPDHVRSHGQLFSMPMRVEGQEVTSKRSRDIEEIDSLGDTRRDRECPECENRLDSVTHTHHGRVCPGRVR